MWPEVLEFLLKNLDSEIGAKTALETVNFIIEDSATHLEEKCYAFLTQLLNKLIYFLNKYRDEKTVDKELLNLVLMSLHVLLENCPNLINEDTESVIEALINLKESQELNTRYHVGRCWLSIFKIKKEVLSLLLEPLFNFFIGNFSVENYQMNLTSAEFFSFIV